jgi:hypothetical protein
MRLALRQARWARSRSDSMQIPTLIAGLGSMV